jgi:hypothetical protein
VTTPIAQALSGIGPRLAGTPAADRAANLLAETFADLGCPARLEAFAFTGWAREAPARLSITAPATWEVPCATMIRSGSGTVEGRLRPAGLRSVIGVFEWPHYEVVDACGQVVATIIQREDGPAIPQCLAEPASMPMVIVGADWLDALGGVAPAEIRVRLSTRCHPVPESTSCNVIATQPGASTDEILICAHYDTMYDSRGANDNASGVDVVTRLARAYAGEQPRLTLRYAAFSGEEWLQLGSKAYLAGRRERGDLARIRLVLNIDMVGKGEYLWPSVTDETQGLVGQAIHDVAPGVQVVYHKPPMRGDHYPFHEMGIPTVMLLWWPDDVYHSPADSADALDEAKLALSTRLAMRMIESVTSTC